MKTIFKKEMRSLLLSPVGFTAIAVMLLFSGLFITVYNLFSGSTRIEHSYQNTATVLLLAVPLLTMNSLSREHGNKTDKLLFSLPLPLYKIILGKYLSVVCITLIPMVITFLYSVILSFYGEVSFLSAFTSTLAFFLCACALLAIGLFISSFFSSPTLCAVSVFAIILLLYFLPTLSGVLPTSSNFSLCVISIVIVLASLTVYKLTESKSISVILGTVFETVLLGVYFFRTDLLEGAIYKVCRFLSVMMPLDAFTVNNTVSIPAYVYFISISALFVFLTVVSEKRRRHV